MSTSYPQKLATNYRIITTGIYRGFPETLAIAGLEANRRERCSETE
jgi:hypothetical protein